MLLHWFCRDMLLKREYLTLFSFVLLAAPASYFALENLPVASPCVTLFLSGVFLKVCFSLHVETCPFSSVKRRITATSFCVFEGRSRTKDSTCCCSRGIRSPARGHVNVCHAFPYLLARTYFSISLILLLCNCQI